MKKQTTGKYKTFQTLCLRKALSGHDEWVFLLRSSRGGKSALMTEEEIAKLNSLPDHVTVWRGCTRRNQRGVSWTLGEEVATLFANRFVNKGQEPVMT